MRFAVAAVLLLAGGGLIDALLAADTALEADAEAVTAPRTTSSPAAPDSVVGAPATLRPSKELADATTTPAPEAKPERRAPRPEAKPDKKSGRSERKGRSRTKPRRPLPPEARPAPAYADTAPATQSTGRAAPGAGGPAPGATPSIGGQPLRPARADRNDRPRREISQVDPDGTIEPYK